MFPENVVQATMQRVQTKYIFSGRRKAPPPAPPKAADLQQQQLQMPAENSSAMGEHLQQHPFRKKIENVHGMNILG